LEFSNANGPATEGWRPRVRKLGRDGKVATLASISQEKKKSPQQGPSQRMFKIVR
jgi:hypothetical protein